MEWVPVSRQSSLDGEELLGKGPEGLNAVGMDDSVRYESVRVHHHAVAESQFIQVCVGTEAVAVDGTAW